jgi:calcineurin-like phosphoesterase family protein
MYWFTADEHYGHKNIIEYSDRPYDSVEEMDECLINNHNQVVQKNDTVIHAGDFTLWKNVEGIYKKYIGRLNGIHIFLKGSHDYWLKWNLSQQIWEKRIDGHYFVVCHYAMRTWARSHYNSFQLFGHSHGKLNTVGKQHDVGVDNNIYFPVSAKQIIDIMRDRPDNPNLIRRN